MTDVTLEVTGMTCAGCARRIERALVAVPGVAAAHVNLALQQATVAVDLARAPRPALVAAVEAVGYGVLPAPLAAAAPIDRAAADAAERRALQRGLALAAVAGLPLLALGMAHGRWSFADAPAGRWLQAALATAVLFGPGLRLLRGGLRAARARSPDMNTLVGLGALAAYGWSLAATAWPQAFAHGGHQPHVYFEAAGAIVGFVLLGKYLESRARWRLGDAIRALHALVPATAHRLAGDEGGRDVGDQPERDVPVASLRAGDCVRVRPGERAPADGVVLHGDAAIDVSLLTGESAPVAAGPGVRIVAGSLLSGGALVLRLDRTGSATALARIAAAVAEAQGSRAPIARLADRASAVFVPIVLALAAATFGAHLAIDASSVGVALAIERMVAVLVMACPCALGLATPAAVAVGAGRGAQLGVLFRTGAALERCSALDLVVFDKTGTLTTGRPEVVAVEPVAGRRDAARETGHAPAAAVRGSAGDALLALAAAVERSSEHPFARAIVAAAQARGLALPAATGFVAAPAMGAQAAIDGAVVRVGTPAWLQAQGVALDGAAAARADAIAAAGRTPLAVARDGAFLGWLAVADAVRADAVPAIARLRALGVGVALASGDRAEVAAAVAAELGIADVHAGLLPADKVALLRARAAAGRRTAMVGDGVNDAPALAAADVGMAMGGGTDVAAAAADVALLRGGLDAVPTAIELARATMRAIRRNLLWASAYNLLGLPLAAGVLAPLGVTLSPMWASAAMSLSSVSVLASSLWLRRFQPRALAG
ncbi:MAG: heavy metal translocating P-type ATPase [Planctomycetota bacterium]